MYCIGKIFSALDSLQSVLSKYVTFWLIWCLQLYKKEGVLRGWFFLRHPVHVMGKKSDKVLKEKQPHDFFQAEYIDIDWCTQAWQMGMQIQKKKKNCFYVKPIVPKLMFPKLNTPLFYNVFSHSIFWKSILLFPRPKKLIATINTITINLHSGYIL